MRQPALTPFEEDNIFCDINRDRFLKLQFHHHYHLVSSSSPTLTHLTNILPPESILLPAPGFELKMGSAATPGQTISSQLPSTGREDPAGATGPRDTSSGTADATPGTGAVADVHENPQSLGKPFGLQEGGESFHHATNEVGLN